MTKYLLFAATLSIYISLTACSSQKEAQTNPSPNAPQAQQKEPETKRYELKGKVVSIDKSQKQMVVDHEAIPGFMGAMAMPYAVQDPAVLDKVGPGDQITAQVVVSEGGVVLDNINVVAKGSQK